MKPGSTEKDHCRKPKEEVIFKSGHQSTKTQMSVAVKGQCSEGGPVVKVAENKRLTDDQWQVLFGL